MDTEIVMRNAVGCPFYRRDDNRSKITCEGIVDGSTVTLSFIRLRDFDTQMRVFCCEYFRKCEIYRMLMEKYDL